MEQLNSQSKKLPPGPWKLPLLGSMLHMAGGLPHHVMKDLAKNMDHLCIFSL
ncbi:hypothetical protein HAX54_050307, partial [Datura stramonium]|nr:hypothetical protein [Datura stramonium]